VNLEIKINWKLIGRIRNSRNREAPITWSLYQRNLRIPPSPSSPSSSAEKGTVQQLVLEKN
ncbi:43470_t:CDS:2, partial [Gigaspora margarita]